MLDLAALNEALAAEVQRLKLAAAEVNGEAQLSSRMAQQLSINHQMFQMQHQQQNQDAGAASAWPTATWAAKS